MRGYEWRGPSINPLLKELKCGVEKSKKKKKQTSRAGFEFLISELSF